MNIQQFWSDVLAQRADEIVEELIASIADKRIPRVFAVEKLDTAKTDTE